MFHLSGISDSAMGVAGKLYKRPLPYFFINSFYGLRMLHRPRIGQQCPERINTDNNANDNVIPHACAVGLETEQERSDNQPDADYQIDPFLPGPWLNQRPDGESGNNYSEYVAIPGAQARHCNQAEKWCDE